jgi:putative transposase
MHFENGHIYHIYNQGNNRQAIFFRRENYLFFLKKIKEHITPHADVLAWCLMPNHFHIMVWVNDNEATTRSATLSRAPSTSRTPSIPDLNKSLGILLASYTRAINKQEDRTGSLFRPKTKAINLTQITQVTPAYFNTQFGTKINITTAEKEYPQICFNYIHSNPVVAKLVKESCNWEFSSAQDYAAMRNGTLINKEKASEVGLVW